jgi:hypothetical protein
MKVTVGTLFLLLVYAGCSLVLKPSDFAWPVESVVVVDEKGRVQDERYSMTVNVKKLLYEETKDSVNVAGISLRLIRDISGYYYITASKFKNVYIFEQADGGLKLTDKIAVSEKGLDSPAFNQRSSHIELVNGKGAPVLLDKNGIVEGEQK